MIRFPYASRRTSTGALLLIYEGGARKRVAWHKQCERSDATQRRFRWQVYPGGKR